MDSKTVFGFLRWLLIALVCAGGVQGLAQTKAAQPTKPPQSPATAPVPRWHGGPRTITDAAGRVHVRHDRITYAQRKAAAQYRLQALRQAAAKRKQAEVKQ